MAITKITYSNKVNINANSSVADINKVNDSDMNQIKTVVNTNADNLGDVANLVGASNVVDALTNMNTYSTSNETMVGVWIDNKPIYRKIFYISSLPNNNWTNVAHNISDMDEITNIYGIMRTPSNHTTTAFNMSGTSAIYGIGKTLVVRADRTNIVIGTSNDWSMNIAYITLEYTKITD